MRGGEGVVQQQWIRALNLKHPSFKLRLQLLFGCGSPSSLRLHINMFALLAVAQSEGTHTGSLHGWWAKRSHRQTYVHWQPETLEDGGWQPFNLYTHTHMCTHIYIHVHNKSYVHKTHTREKETARSACINTHTHTCTHTLWPQVRTQNTQTLNVVSCKHTHFLFLTHTHTQSPVQQAISFYYS